MTYQLINLPPLLSVGVLPIQEEKHGHHFLTDASYSFLVDLTTSEAIAIVYYESIQLNHLTGDETQDGIFRSYHIRAISQNSPRISWGRAKEALSALRKTLPPREMLGIILTGEDTRKAPLFQKWGFDMALDQQGMCVLT